MAEMRSTVLPRHVRNRESFWATQRLKLADGGEGLSRMVLADPGMKTILWTTRSADGGEGSATVDRIIVSEGEKETRVTWTSASSRALPDHEKNALRDSKAQAFSHLRHCLGLSDQNVPLQMFVGAQDGDTGQNSLKGDTKYEGDAQWLDPDTNTWMVRPWSVLKRGDVVRVEKMGYFPADLLLLDSPCVPSSPSRMRTAP